MKQHLHTLAIATSGRGFVDATPELARWLKSVGAQDGLLTVFIRHTSASLLIQENADASAKRDLERWLNRLVPEDDELYTHTTEGADDMPAHVRSALTQTQLSIPVRNGKAQLGTWQAVYVWEHRTSPHVRKVSVTVVG